ncbi:MAG: DGQHR domain-containing protein [bacterium]|nr:DGQHR domain-containing protein [bacterium]
MSRAKERVVFSALEINQPIGTFYIGAINSEDLVKIAKADIRRIEDDGLDNYIGIQRRLSNTRVKDIHEYVHNVDATFPTSVILAVPEENAEWDEDKKELTLFSTDEKELKDIATIIDGQHRVEGLKDYKGELFQVSVAIFVGIALPVQANIFATVNLAQTKVNKSLVYDLFDYEKNRSPQKSAHHIALSLNTYKNSPLKNRIKRLGTATRGQRNEQLTQATVVERMLEYMTDNAPKDRNTYLMGLKPKLYTEEESREFIFGNMFLKGDDVKITEVLVNYFTAVSKKWPNSWGDFTTKGNILPKTNGFIALMAVLRPIYLKISDAKNEKNYVPTVQEFSSILKKVTQLEDGHINNQIFKPGGGGANKMKQMLLEDIFGVTLEAEIDW